MLFAHIKHSLRRFNKGRIYALLNIAGLTAGISAALMIFLWIAQETSYDRQWPGDPLIYRVSEEINYNNGNHDRFALSGFPLAPSLQEHIPSIDAYCRISYSGNPVLAWLDDESFSVDNFHYVDTNFLEFFEYPVLYGNPKTAFNKPEKAVIDKETALRLFKKENALGESMRIGSKIFIVSAVIDTKAINSHLDPHILIPNTNYPNATVEAYNRDWTRMANYTYIRFMLQPDMGQLRQQMKEWNQKVIEAWIEMHELTWSLDFSVHPIEDVHFSTKFQYDFDGNSNARLIYIFGTIAFFILLLASINYINLSTARAMKRARETGIRKAVGASRNSLMFLYMSEAVFTTLLAFVFALVISELLLPFFGQISGNEEILLSSFSAVQWVLAIVFAILIGMLSGFFPAMVLSSYKAVDSLKGSSMQGSKGSSQNLQLVLRKSLIVFQFFISTSLIFGTLVVYAQMNFMKNSDTGYERDHVLVFNIPRDTLIDKKLPDMRSRFLQNPGVEQVSLTRHLPSKKPGRLTFYIDRDGNWEQQMLSLYTVDQHFADLLKIPVVKGRFFDEKNKTDRETAVVLNEAAVKMLGWENDPLGHRLANGLGVDGKVIGVVKDFHFTSLHNTIEPMALQLLPHRKSYMLLKINVKNLKTTLKDVESQWQEFIGKYPSEYFFLDEDLMNGYQRDEKLFDLFSAFSILGLAISILGLIGLVVYTAEQKTREIGIRKTLGANINQLMFHISSSYFYWLIGGIFLSWPLSWWAMDQWLTDFAYRIGIHPAFYLLSGLFSILLSILSVGIITYKAARTNPVDALRYE